MIMACRCGATPRTVKALSSLFQQIVRGGAQALGRLGAFPHAQPAPQLLPRALLLRPPEIGRYVAIVTFAGCANELPFLPFIQQL